MAPGRGLEQHVLVLGDGEVDGVEDGAVLIQGPGVDVDEVGDLLPVPPGVEAGLGHHGRGVADGSACGGTEQEHQQVPEQDDAHTHQQDGANGRQVQVGKGVLYTGFDGIQIEASALVGEDVGGEGSDDGHNGRHVDGCCCCRCYGSTSNPGGGVA